MADKILELTKTQTFHSRWLEKEGVYKIEIHREGGVKITVSIDNEQYEETIKGVSWSVAVMLYDNAITVADTVIFKNRCIIADGEIWLISGDLKGNLTVSCKTAEHFCEGRQIMISEIGNMISKIIEEEVPF